MTNYDYTSWQFLDAIGQASPLQVQDEAVSLAFEFPSPSTANGNESGQLMGSDNCLPCGQTSAKTVTGFMHAHSDSPPIELGMNIGIDMDMEMEMEMEMFAQGMEFISIPTFPDFNLLGHHSKKAPNLLSHNINAAAAERALFMTPSATSPSSSSSPSSNQHSSPSQSLELDPCTPSTTSTASKESDEHGDRDCEWDHPTSKSTGPGHYFYKLPDRLCFDSFQAVHPHHHRVNNTHRQRDDAEARGEELTPLEMPDGSTRLTANWLPVDPTGGFTIGLGLGIGRNRSFSASAPAVEYGYANEYGHGRQDHGYGYAYAYAEGDPFLELEFSKDAWAFIQMPAPKPV